MAQGDDSVVVGLRYTGAISNPKMKNAVTSASLYSPEVPGAAPDRLRDNRPIREPTVL